MSAPKATVPGIFYCCIVFIVMYLIILMSIILGHLYYVLTIFLLFFINF